ncbi:MAG: hypothetical protein M3416_00275 [Acidobacteriota bacterium]|nr:hypothetical protein [Acidobacteriota bacterium]
MSEDTAARTRLFLVRFFGEHNELKLDQIEGGQGAAGVLAPWVKRLTLTPPLASVIPHKFSVAGGEARYNWYALAHTERELRDLNEDLTAFVGPTWSTFRGERARLDPTNPTDLIVQEFTGDLAIKFSGNTKKIWESLEMMRRVWERRKVRPVEDLRPSGRVLRDFYMALQAGNRESAESALRSLQHQHGYDAINISFLRVQMLAALEQWGELLGSTELADLLQVRRPVAVTQALITAVYRRELKQFEERGDVAAAREHFRREVLPRYGSLFTVRAGMGAPEVIKSFMLLAVNDEQPNPTLRDELIALDDLGEQDKTYVQQLAALLPPAPPKPSPDPLQRAKELLWDGEYDQAFELAVNAPASERRTQILLNCAYELQTLASERAAVDAFNELPAEQRLALTAARSNRVFLERITGTDLNLTLGAQPEVPISINTVPRNWLEWLSRLYAEPGWPRAVEVARQGATEWGVKPLLQEPNGINLLVQQLSSYPAPAETTLHNCLPFFLEFFRGDDEFPRRECSDVYSVLLDVLTLSTKGGDDDLTLFNELVMAQLSLGMDASKYAEVLSNAEDLWGRYASPSKVDWILDLIDSLVLYPSPAENRRGALLNFAANKFTQFARRIEPVQWNFLSLLARDLHQEELLTLIAEYEASVEESATAPVDALTYLTGKTVTIYTLTEAVAQRVRSIIQSVCEGAVVNLSHDKVGSERLRQLARGSDIFIMATASAKHAATEFIEVNRPAQLPLLRPSGKGSASMLRILRSYLEAAVAV